MLPMLQPEPALFNCGSRTVNGPTTPSTAPLPPSLTPDSEVDELVDIFFDVDVAVNTYQRIESCDLQPGDTWRGMQGKMSVTAPVKKIRKKSDSKPQSQINKCHNEKRRRELENETINQLEELLGTCLAEVKQPDKNGIVREATRQIQEVLKRRRECPEECPLRHVQALSPVQAGEISSTQLYNAGQNYSELTTLIEALKHYTGSLGWVLLEINSKGEIECVTENIKDLIFHDRIELFKKSIFSLLHCDDHGKLRPLLRNVQNGWPTADADKYHVIQANFLIKNTNVSDSTGVVECVIHCAAVRGLDAGGSVMCVIRRCDSAALCPGPPALAPALHENNIVFRLSTDFIILSCDLSGIEGCSGSRLVGSSYLELVEECSRARVECALRSATPHPAPPAPAPAYRLRVAPARPVRVSSRSRLFRAKPGSRDPDFIMSAHTLVPDDEEPAMPPQPIGGPLMTSVANGESSGYSPADAQFINDFDLDPWSDSILGDLPEEAKPKETLEPVRAPPPPAVEAPPPPEEPNRLRTLLSKKPGPEGSNNRILKDLLKQEDEEATSSETSAPHTPHTPGPAPSPLHSRPSPHPALPSDHHNNADMLLRILNDKSDEDLDDSRRNAESRGGSAPSALLTQLLSSSAAPAAAAAASSSSSAAPAAAAAAASSSSAAPAGSARADDNAYLERMAGVKRKLEEAKAAATSAKRATPETHQVSSSAASPAACSSTATMSSLCQKNQILVSLLARQQTTPTTPLPLPNPILRPYSRPAPAPAPAPASHHPQPRMHSPLSTMLAHGRTSNVNGSGSVVPASSASELGGGSHLQMVLQNNSRHPYPPPQHQQQMHYTHHYHQTSGGNRQAGNSSGDSEVPSDQTLSDILDEVIDNMPDSDRPAPEVGGLIDLEPRPMRPDYGGMKESAMINAIRQSLMQCETVSKGPVPSPGAPPGYPQQSSCGSGMYAAAREGAARVLAEQHARAEQQHGAARALAEQQQQHGAARALAEHHAAPRGHDQQRALADQHSGARALVEQQRARLLQMQRSQQMLVPPEAAEQPQSDLGSTINALVSATPPNVALTRTDYHHLYHPTNQMGSNYGTNKITSSQQNPMLSRQLSGGGQGGYSNNAAALHTPVTPQPYLRAPRPHLVGGYYEESGYCGDYARRGPPAPLAAPLDRALPLGGVAGVAGVAGGAGGAGGTSEYVRNELRAVVGARSRPDLHVQLQPDLDLMAYHDMPAPGGSSGGRGAAAGVAWDSQPTTPSTTEAGSAGAEAAVGAGGDAAEAGAGTTAAAKASLLQKLLSQ